jgi:polyisoprenoid-binding protein YceI
MRKTILLAMSILLLSGTTLAEAAEWQADTVHSVLSFKIRHLFSKTAGKFDEWSATLDFDSENVEKGRVEVTIQTASINTDNEDRDAHLKSPDFFHVEKYPTMNFTSEKIEKTEDGYLMHGTLTMAGVSKEISIPFEFLGAGQDPWGATRAGFAGKLTINRKDFGIEWNKAMDKGGFILGEDVDIDIEIEAVQAGA